MSDKHSQGEDSAHGILSELSDNVTKGIECSACEGESTVWVGMEEMLICSGEGDSSCHASVNLTETH